LGQLFFSGRTIARAAEGRYLSDTQPEPLSFMPELPEVETVRRGLAPEMEGARFDKVEVNDRRLRWPIAKGFEQRITGTKVEGLGRRAKYLTADLSSGEVLLMHLGMSGSFRVGKDTTGRYYHARDKHAA